MAPPRVRAPAAWTHPLPFLLLPAGRLCHLPISPVFSGLRPRHVLPPPSVPQLLILSGKGLLHLGLPPYSIETLIWHGIGRPGASLGRRLGIQGLRGLAKPSTLASLHSKLDILLMSSVLEAKHKVNAMQQRPAVVSTPMSHWLHRPLRSSLTPLRALGSPRWASCSHSTILPQGASCSAWSPLTSKFPCWSLIHAAPCSMSP
ncbi:uncharacterized protein LOC111552577 [Piliocolobus tephrosceles]|uniref:uncharacterized protein LOC111552577 n=1 Tax=Piliocolobus tephrosceles TaxID=591936 RepID=UPI000C2B4FA9|nr:uncharacterized protein LOC111552577 [Piliocolobus tephrosceles]